MKSWQLYYSRLVMFFRAHRKTHTLIVRLILAISVSMPFALYGNAEEPSLTINPSRCIALHEGQICYVNLKIEWKSLPLDEYCLFDERYDEPLVCWQGNELASYVYDFNAKANVNFIIRNKGEGEEQVKALVRISWVYKSNNKNTSRWRLF